MINIQITTIEELIQFVDIVCCKRDPKEIKKIVEDINKNSDLLEEAVKSQGETNA